MNSVSELEKLAAPITSDSGVVSTGSSPQAILLDSGNESLFLKALKKIPDIKERVILIKNIEKFSTATINACLDFKKIILSGNIDECAAKDTILKNTFESIIAFNQPVTPVYFSVATLEKWTGYLFNSTKNGVVSLEKED